MLAAVYLLVLGGAAGAVESRSFYGPAVEDYRATAEDFRMFEAAIAGALSVAPEHFPSGVGDVDVIMQDTSDFYLYSRKADYPYQKVKRWRQYQVYRLPHRRPAEHEMWGCAGGPPSVMEVDDRRITAEYSIRCAPWGSFRRAQERKRSRYRFRQAYLATMVHEYGHQYEEMRSNDPTPRMEDVRRRAQAAKIPKDVDRASMEREAFAQYCELAASKALYPAHHLRMLEEAKGGDGSRGAHHEALIVAYEAFLSESGASRSKVGK